MPQSLSQVILHIVFICGNTVWNSMNGMFGPDGDSLCLGRHGARHESRFQRSEWASAEKPRALPWAGMRDAVGVSLACANFCRTPERRRWRLKQARGAIPVLPLGDPLPCGRKGK
jgi:hypothetical protein